MKKLIYILLIGFIPLIIGAQSSANDQELKDGRPGTMNPSGRGMNPGNEDVRGTYRGGNISLDLEGEMGFIGLIKHEIQAGSTSDKGDVFNYITQGNQDNLFPFMRFQADLSLFKRHHLVLLYQPLTLKTISSIDADFRYNKVNFVTTDGTLDLLYGFDFWRFSYLFDIFEAPGFFWSAGLSLQIRNATIGFQTSVNGKVSVTNNIGPVPIIKMRIGYEWKNGIYLMFDGDGFYASSQIFNGATYPFTGYLYDLSLRGGVHFNRWVSTFLNVRFLGGGATGTNDAGQFTYNDLHTLGTSVGVTLHLF